MTDRQDRRIRDLSIEIARLRNELEVRSKEIMGLQWRLARKDEIPRDVYRVRAGELYKATATALAAIKKGFPEEAAAILEQAIRNRHPAEEKRNPTESGMHPNGLAPRTYPRRANIRKRMSPTTRARVFERDNYSCRACGTNGDPDNPLTVDHIVAIAEGGSNKIENLQVLCARCHNKKDKRVMDGSTTYGYP